MNDNTQQLIMHHASRKKNQVPNCQAVGWTKGAAFTIRRNPMFLKILPGIKILYKHTV